MFFSRNAGRIPAKYRRVNTVAWQTCQGPFGLLGLPSLPFGKFFDCLDQKEVNDEVLGCGGRVFCLGYLVQP